MITPITGLGCNHGFWNMVLRASHVLAQGAGTCDVVGDMWKLSRVYPDPVHFGEGEREQQQSNIRKTCTHANKHADG